jgi:hypothetical protein
VHGPDHLRVDASGFIGWAVIACVPVVMFAAAAQLRAKLWTTWIGLAISWMLILAWARTVRRAR